ncbi:MAG: hypothetical protein ACI80V_002260 [Rhodothermales bacterium]|jgi:hypothetical protein
MNNQILHTAKLAMLAQRLAETLTAEVAALESVRDALKGMLEAIRTSDQGQLNESAMALQDCVHAASEHRSAHSRQIDLFFRIAGVPGDSISSILLLLHPVEEASMACNAISAARKAIHEIARESGRLVAAADYSLRYAGQVNHELILMLHGLMQPDRGKVYTARGETPASRSRRSMLDQRG